jgi:hypothetical protein
VQRRGLRHHAEPFVPDAGQAGHPAASVRAEQVLAAHRVAAAGGVVADRGPHPLGVLLETGQLVAEADPSRGQLLGPGLEQRLEADLRQVQLPPRAGRPPVLVVPAGAPALQAGQAAPVVRVRAGEARVERRGRHLLRGRAPLGDRGGHARVVQHLHRPLVQDMGLGQVGGLRARADQQVIHPQAGQQHRGGQAGAAAAHDQDRDFLVDFFREAHRAPLSLELE